MAEHAIGMKHVERRLRLLAVWAAAVPFGRDIDSVISVQHPREAFRAGAYPEVPAGVEPETVPAGDARS